MILKTPIQELNDYSAREKRCPFEDSNGGSNLGSKKMCDGSSCMAWAWHYEEYSDKFPKNSKIKPIPRLIKTDKGYCARIHHEN